MSPHVFAYRDASGVPLRITWRHLPDFGHGPADERYRLVDDDETAEKLLERSEAHTAPLFRHLGPDELEAALGSADDAIAAIEAGEYDADLDLVLFAERATDNRVTVIEAIERRIRTIEEERAADGDDAGPALTPEDVTARL